MSDRRELLERHGACFGEMHLALAFTDGITGEDAKKNSKGWKQTRPLQSAEQGRGVMAVGLTRNPIVVLGASGLVGIDVDGDAGRALLRTLAGEVRFPTTVTVISGGGGHLWYRPPAGDAREVVKVQLKTAVTVSADGYFVCPPARHPGGHVYHFVEGREPWTIEIAELPSRTIEVLAREGRLRKAAIRHEVGEIGTGDRHEHLRQISWAMRRYSGASQEAIEAALLAENELRCRPTKAEHLVRALAEYTYLNVDPIGEVDE